MPIFFQRQLIGFSTTTAHHLDIGALTPGSCGIVDAVDTYAEGLQFKAIKVFDQGRRNEAVWQLLRDNIRAPDLVVGDMEAQIQAAPSGRSASSRWSGSTGSQTVQAACEDLMDYSERLMRQAISELPDGVYAATTTIDGYLDDPDPARRDLPIAVDHHGRGDELTVDLTGTAPQVPDKPINMPLEGTVDCAIWLTLRSILLDSEVYGNIPQNSGLTRPIKIVAPRGYAREPDIPRADDRAFLPRQRARRHRDEGAGAGGARPRSPPASAICASSRSADCPAASTGCTWRSSKEATAAGYGLDGMDAVDTLYANTRNNPIEDIESHLPLRVDALRAARERDGAPGEWRGGIGSIREFTYLADGGFSVEGEGHKYRPWGFAGGADGFTAGLRLQAADGSAEAAPLEGPVSQGEGRRPADRDRTERRRLWRSEEARAGGGAVRRARRLRVGAGSTVGLCGCVARHDGQFGTNRGAARNLTRQHATS